MAYEKRRYQTEAIDATLAAFAEKGRESVLLESPVGSGKTYMALEMLHRLQEKLGRQLRINWVAPRHRLLQQVMEANRDLYRDSIRPVSLFASAPPEADFVVLDEAHHEATQSCVLLYEKMRAKWTLGLSATPLRTDRMKLSFQETVRTCPIGRLIREGYLSPFNSYLIPTYSVDSVADHYLAAPEGVQGASGGGRHRLRGGDGRVEQGCADGSVRGGARAGDRERGDAHGGL